MEPIPKPLLLRLLLTFLVGTGCFFTGLVLFLHQKDISFFILSILLIYVVVLSVEVVGSLGAFF